MDAIGNLYIADQYNQRIRKVDPSGTIISVAGTGQSGYNGDGILASKAALNYPTGVAVDAAGKLYIADNWGNRIREVSREAAWQLQLGEELVTENGTGHVISAAGRHLATVDLATGTELFSFVYGPEGLLVSIKGINGNATTIQRDQAGTPTAIVSPDGLATILTIDANNQLTHVTFPDDSYYEFGYTSDGLMTDEWDPKRNHVVHGYDTLGSLTDVFDPEGGHWTYDQATGVDGVSLTIEKTGELNLTSYQESRNFLGVYTQLTTTSYGASSSFVRAADDLSATTNTTCGMEVEQTYDIDPEFKHTILKASTATLPNGLSRASTTDRIYQDTDLDGVADEVTGKITINGSTWTSANDTLTGTITATSPANRTVTTMYDPYGAAGFLGHRFGVIICAQ
ncbi:MAG: hypothetical protein P1P84_00525, partial [Deferrisomatales bacterium]|nr:hypothetical protein [Deferrisomatales bacterium]